VVFGVGLPAHLRRARADRVRRTEPGVALGLFLAGSVLGRRLGDDAVAVWFAVGSTTLLAVLAIMPILAGDVAAPKPLPSRCPPRR